MVRRFLGSWGAQEGPGKCGPEPALNPVKSLPGLQDYGIKWSQVAPGGVVPHQPLAIWGVWFIIPADPDH